MANQVENGKAFECAVALAASEALGVPIVEGQEFSNSKSCYEKVSPRKRDHFLKAAKLAVAHIKEREAARFNRSCAQSVWIARDDMGQRGDVRDVIIRLQEGEIGISCKTNHDAFKHSRLSGKADFVRTWGLDPSGCSEKYWAAVGPVFAELAAIRAASNAQALWAGEKDVPERFYWKVLDAFEEEVLRLTDARSPKAAEVSKNLISYIIGNHDFYKVISRQKQRGQVEIQGFNLNGSLAGSRTRYPEHVIGIDRLDGGQYSKTVRFNRGFAFNFRIHSASSRVEPSLKFDVKAISLPPNEIYTHHITC